MTRQGPQKHNKELLKKRGSPEKHKELQGPQKHGKELPETTRPEKHESFKVRKVPKTA